MLTKNKVAYVDDEDFERVNQFRWYASDGGTGKVYAKRRPYYKDTGRYGTISMHRFIMNPPKGMEVDHIDGVTLNNLKSNLRICTHAQNSYNTKLRRTTKSGYKGISWNKHAKKWISYIQHRDKYIYLGIYSSIADAIQARKDKEKELFGDFSHQ